MVSKTAEILGVDEHEVILLACCWLMKRSGDAIYCPDPEHVYDVYEKTGFVPGFVVDYCSMKEGENHG